MSLDKVVEKRLQAGLQQLGLSLSPAPFLTYLHLLQKWNQAYNLTAIANVQDMVVKHILDSLAILPWVNGRRIIDVGSGPGLPGIPLALALPEKEIVLLDSNGKKTRFLREVKRILKLPNICIVHDRAENYQPTQGFDTVVSRAFRDLLQMVQWTEHLLAPEGIWLAMKGRYPQAELDMLTIPYSVKSYQVPTLKDERCCVVMAKAPAKA